MTQDKFSCSVCGKEMPCDWPSGVCSIECHRNGAENRVIPHKDNGLFQYSTLMEDESGVFGCPPNDVERLDYGKPLNTNPHFILDVPRGDVGIVLRLPDRKLVRISLMADGLQSCAAEVNVRFRGDTNSVIWSTIK